MKKPATAAIPQRDGKLGILVQPIPVKAKAAASWPMTAGVALPMGAIYSPDNARLLGPDGQEVPCRAQVRARWPTDGSIRWLGLDFQADIARKGGERFTLEYGPEVTAAAIRGFTRSIEGMRSDAVADAWVTDTGDAWWVNTGALYFNVNYKHYSGIENTWVDVHGNGHYGSDGQILNSEVGGSGPYLVDSYGTVYRLANDPKVRVELEEYNELRLVLRVEGRLLPADRPGAKDARALRAAHNGVPGRAVPARPMQFRLQRAHLARSAERYRHLGAHGLPHGLRRRLRNPRGFPQAHRADRRSLSPEVRDGHRPSSERRAAAGGGPPSGARAELGRRSRAGSRFRRGPARHERAPPEGNRADSGKPRHHPFLAAARRRKICAA